MTRSRTFAAYAVSLLLILVLLSLPLVPMSALFEWSSVSSGDSRNHTTLSPADLDLVVRRIKSHEMYGVREGVPLAISLFDLLSGRERVGILDISGEGGWAPCPECSVAVATGRDCGGLCGRGTTYFLARRAGQWEILAVISWMS
jgi:hypothetical protein